MLEFTRKNYLTAFVFHAMYCSIIFGIVFLVNDYLDDYFGSNGGDNKFKKTSIHIITTFCVTLLLVLLFWFLFGWGAGFTPSKK